MERLLRQGRGAARWRAPTMAVTAAAAVAAMTMALALALAGVAGAGCGDGDAPNGHPGTAATLTPDPRQLSIKPGETAVVRFLLTSSTGSPVPDERIDFALLDDESTPQSDPAGATLSASSATTDALGLASVQVTGGLKTSFKLAARHPKAGNAITEVTVGGGDRGTVAVVTAPSERALAATALESVDLLLYDKRRCADLYVPAPPAPVRPPRQVAPGEPAELEVSADAVTAVVGHGRDGDGKLQAVGCIDVPGTAASGASPVRIYLPLALLVPAPSGTYALSSQLSLSRREVARRLADPWQDLGDCPLDPAQLWLDCTIDALGAGDALDCVPAAGAEGALGEAITALRGTISTGSRCRQPKTAGGADALDFKVAALYLGTAEPPARELALALGAEAAALLDKLTIASTLSVEPTERAGAFQGTHALRSVSFLVGTRSRAVDVVAQGSPAAEARFVRIATLDEYLVVSSHGLGLRLGTLAHAAFADDALAGRGLPRDTRAFVDALLALASTTTAGATRVSGCEALDALVCGAVPGQAAGCVRAACAAGAGALASRLDAGFAAADGKELDLVLFGSAVMLDDGAGDGVADRLGDAEGSAEAGPGLWNVELRASAGTETLSGSWTAARVP